MALIKPKNKTNKTKIRVDLEAQVLEELKLYQECIGEEDTSYVIQEAIKQLFKAKEYRVWKKEKVGNL
jgi:hypothetical protein